jgi:hypothetical protein
VAAEKIKYMVMARDQNAGQNYDVKGDNKSLKGWKNIWEQP